MQNVPSLSSRLGLVSTALLLLVGTAQPATALPVDELTVLLQSENEDLNQLLDFTATEGNRTYQIPPEVRCVIRATLDLVTFLQSTPVGDYLNDPEGTARKQADYVSGHYLATVQLCIDFTATRFCSYRDLDTWLDPPIPASGQIVQGDWQIGVPFWNPAPRVGETNMQQLRVAFDRDSQAEATC